MFGNNKLAVISDKKALVIRKPRGIWTGKDLGDKVGPYLFFEDRICNFAISGQGNKENLIKHVLGAAAGRIPIIILHNNNHAMMAKVAQIWTNEFGSVEYAEEGPLWSCNAGGFEPFLGLDEMDIVQIMKNLALSMNYSCSAGFEKVVKAHLSILRHGGCEYSLFGLNYLCGFEDLEEFKNNILALPCSMSEKNRILANMGLSNERDREQFDQFRSLIAQLAYEARKSGWEPEKGQGCMNVTTAIRERALMTLSVSNNRSELLLAYIGQELKLHSDDAFLLIVDEVRMKNSGILDALRDAGHDFRFGLIGSNILELIGNDREEAQAFCEKLDRIVLLKHGIATTAQALSELIGSIEVEKKTKTTGSGKEYFSLLPDSLHKSVAVTTEDRSRIRTEHIQNLADNRAILFNTATNEILLL